MARKDCGIMKDSKEKSEKSVRKEGSANKESKGKDKEVSDKTVKKEPLSSKETKTREKDPSSKETEEVKASFVYELNSKVLCKHRDTLYYEAKVIGVDDIPDKGRVYTVHYQGWNSRHDEKIPEADAAQRFLQCTEENLEMARSEMQEARLMEKKRKGKKVSSLNDDKKSGGADSRGSTPSEKVSSRSSTLPLAEKSTPSTTGRKRKLTNVKPEPTPVDEFGVPKVEVKIEIPLSLKDILVDDQDMIVRQLHLVDLPARYTVEDIIKQYAEYTGVARNGENEITFEHNGNQTKMTKDTLIESSHGLQDYFNTTLGSQLLYKFERPQYAEFYHEKTEEISNAAKTETDVNKMEVDEDPAIKKWRPSETYGFIHLLRLFVKFGSMLGLTNWSDRAVQNIVEHVHDFLNFLDKNRQKFFDLEKDYIVASPEYQKRVWNA